MEKTSKTVVGSVRQSGDWGRIALVGVGAGVAAVLAGACMGSNGSLVAPTEQAPERAVVAPCASPGEAPAFAVEPARGVSPANDVAAVNLNLELISTFDEPTGLAFRCEDESFYVLERNGRVYKIAADGDPRSLVLDIRVEVNDEAWEQGLLGIAFSPDGSRLYLSFTDAGNDVRLVEYAVGDDGVEQSSRRDVLTAPQAHPLHNGGHLTFGPDGMLYFGVGDGESPASAQQLDRLPGSILRLDPSNGDEGITPSDNPFVGREGARGPIWVWGVRNPWRFSFDRATADLWIGDVGDARWEEISTVPFGETAGTNFGWPAYEGSHPFSVWDRLKAIAPELRDPVDPVMPVHEYEHAGSDCAVVAGHVYRGHEIGGLAGAFVFADLCAQELRALPGDERAQPVALSKVEGQPTAFAEDPAGELVLLTREPGGLHRVTAPR